MFLPVPASLHRLMRTAETDMPLPVNGMPAEMWSLVTPRRCDTSAHLRHDVLPGHRNLQRVQHFFSLGSLLDAFHGGLVHQRRTIASQVDDGVALTIHR